MTSRQKFDGARDALWASTAVPGPETAKLQQNLSCDVVVIGGGWTGLVAALYLARKGVSVIVIESQYIGFGASGRSGGQVNLGLNLGPDELSKKFGVARADALIHEVVNTPTEVFNLIEQNNLNCDPVRNGWIQAALTRRNLLEQEALARQFAPHGARFELLDQRAVQTRSGSNHYLGGLFHAGAGSIHPLSYTRELARTALACGAKIFTETAARKIIRDGHRWTVNTTSIQIRSESVLICTNAYTDDLVPGLKETVTPLRSVLMASEPLPQVLRSRILPGQITFVDKRRLILYFRYDRDGRLCVGDHGPTRDTFYLSDYTALKKRVLEVFPDLSSVRWEFHWGGRVAMTRDALPFLSELQPGLVAGLGYNGRGVGMGTVMGRALAQHVLGDPNDRSGIPVTTPGKFSFHRFHRVGISAAVQWYGLRDRLDKLTRHRF